MCYLKLGYCLQTTFTLQLSKYGQIKLAAGMLQFPRRVDLFGFWTVYDKGVQKYIAFSSIPLRALHAWVVFTFKYVCGSFYFHSPKCQVLSITLI